LSARARREGRGDPYGELEQFTYDAFVQVEHSRAVIDTIVQDIAANQAIFLSFIGQPREAGRLLEWTVRITSSTATPRRVRARMRLAQAVVLWNSPQRARALVPALQSAFLDSPGATVMLARGARARLARAIHSRRGSGSART
jgi:hypothetical protein